MRYRFAVLLSTAGLGLVLSTPSLSAPVQSYELQRFSVLYQNVAVSGDVQEKAKDFVSSLVDRGLGFLSDSEISKEEQKKQFTQLLETSFDMRTIGRFALGRYWRNANEEQRDEYLTLFEKMVIEVYSRRFGEYDGQKVEVRSARPEGKSDVVVASYIIQANGPEVQVNWRVRYKNGSFKVIDVFVEGVSMALTQRSDFAAVIQRGGGDIEVLLDHLRNKF